MLQESYLKVLLNLDSTEKCGVYLHFWMDWRKQNPKCKDVVKEKASGYFSAVILTLCLFLQVFSQDRIYNVVSLGFAGI